MNSLSTKSILFNEVNSLQRSQFSSDSLNKYVSLDQISEQLGVPESTLVQLCKRHEAKLVKLGGSYQARLDELDMLIEREGIRQRSSTNKRRVKDAYRRKQNKINNMIVELLKRRDETFYRKLLEEVRAKSESEESSEE